MVNQEAVRKRGEERCVGSTGVNAGKCVLQTGSGKTFTITGGAERYIDRGLIPRSLSYIFEQIEQVGGCGTHMWEQIEQVGGCGTHMWEQIEQVGGCGTHLFEQIEQVGGCGTHLFEQIEQVGGCGTHMWEQIEQVGGCGTHIFEQIEQVGGCGTHKEAPCISLDVVITVQFGDSCIHIVCHFVMQGVAGIARW